jgi:Fur family ferric uptake transcriptional regulator
MGIKADFKKQLNKSNLKLTGQRQIILNSLIENSEKHLNIEEIHQLLLQQGNRIGIATVYRTLNLLEKLELVSKINVDDGYTRYQLLETQEEHEHHHLICERCNRIIDIQDDLLDSLEKQVHDQYGFHVTNHKVKIFGVCKECLRK